MASKRHGRTDKMLKLHLKCLVTEIDCKINVCNLF